MSLNRATIIGNLGETPTLDQGRGKARANLRVATTRRWKNQDGSPNDATEWHDVVTFDKLAEICAQHLEKGRQVYVEGRLETQKWTDRAGVERYRTRIVASSVEFLGGKKRK